MKVKAFVISGLLTIFITAQVWGSNLDIDDQTSKTKLIKLVSVEILEKNINKILAIDYFLERTGLHTKLGGTTKCLEEINLAIDLAIRDYVNSFRGNPSQVGVMQRLMFLRKPFLRQAILKSSQPDQGLDQ